MKYNILIVDDVEINRKLIKAILNHIDDVVLHEAEDGQQALCYLWERDIDLIILDLMMPVMDGFQVLDELKSMEKTREIPVIVCSTMDSSDSLQSALKLGAYDYFTKPLTKDQMSVIIPLKVKNALKANEQRKLLIQANERLRYLSFHDSLTGLYNRAFLDFEVERMEKDITSFLPLTVLLVDVNGLKIVNDVFGHRAGDELIKTVARIMSAPFRKVDMIARIGGDEFCAILAKMDQELAEVKKGEILNLISCYNSDSPVIPLSLSLGMATSEDINKGIYSIYQEADDRMYKHKLDQSAGTESKILELLTGALKKRDDLTQGHGDRMAEGAKEMAGLLNLSPDVIKNLVLLAKFHDLGKIGIPDTILYKKGKLTAQEYEKVKEHSRTGYNIAKRTRELSHIAGLILHHHERYDGKGYPDGLKGEAIPLECRILSVLDAFDAMTNERPYREKLSIHQAIEELKKHSGTQFDPCIVDGFINYQSFNYS